MSWTMFIEIVKVIMMLRIITRQSLECGIRREQNTTIYSQKGDGASLDDIREGYLPSLHEATSI